MEKNIELHLHEENNRNHKLDCKLDWIKLALNMVERGDPNASNHESIDAFVNKLDNEHVQIE